LDPTEDHHAAEGQPALRRALSLPLLTLYGIGTTVGAGIYVLVGEVAAQAGPAAPFSFVIAAVLAGLSALSFAELCSRFPRSAGEAIYVHEAFGSRGLATLVGLLVVAAGTISAATILRGATGYVDVFVPLPHVAIVVVLAVGLGALAIWGIAQAASAAALLTLVELAGLALVIWVGGPALERLPEAFPTMVPDVSPGALVGLVSGALIAFFAFIGFEDMVNVAEEVKNAPVTLPLAIVLTLVVTTMLYFAVTLVAVLAVPPDVLTSSSAPLAAVLETGFAGGPGIISAISLIAIVNGALVQMIMASRILYGLSRSGALPAFLGRVHSRTRTPVAATVIVTALIMTAAAVAPLVTLAKLASLTILVVFILVNLALLTIKRRAMRQHDSGARFSVPAAVPILGLLASAGMVLFELVRWSVS